VAIIVFLQGNFQAGQQGCRSLRVFVDPPVVDEADRHRVQEMEFLPARPAGDDKPGFLQHAQVLHDPEPGHRHVGFQLGERAAVTLEKPVQQETPGGVGERLEDAVVVIHHEQNT
jgi:hypothetical protein